MSGNTTANQSPLIKAQVYSEFLLEAIEDGMLPDGFARDVTDFGDGETLYIPVLGDVVLRDYEEDTGVVFDAVDSGQITLNITEYVSSASYITDKLKQDGYKAAALEASIPRLHLRSIMEAYETDLLSQANNQTANDPNTINGFNHRWVADGGTTNNAIDLDDLVYAKLALDKANAPDMGRVGIVDPISEAALNQLAGNQAFVASPKYEGIAETGFARNHRFVANIFGQRGQNKSYLNKVEDPFKVRH